MSLAKLVSLALVVAALSFTASPAHAECAREAADVSWVRLAGAEACPDAGAIRTEVARRLGTEIGAKGEGRSIEAVVEGKPGAYSARIHIRGCGAPEAERTITSEAATCTPIANAATLVIALAIDPEAALRPPAEEPAPTPPKPAPTPPKATPPKPRAAPEIAPAPPPEPRVETAVTLRGLATVGLLPKVAPGVAWSAEWRPHPIFVVTSGLSWLPEQRADDPTFAFGMTAGWVGACADLLRTTNVSLGPCARILAGAIHAVLYTDPEVTPTDPGARAWVGLGAGARVAVRVVGPLRVEAGLDLVAPLTRHAFSLRDASAPVFLQPPLTGALFLGAGVAFR
ncbi:hypothetical protein [Polyangium aurulentum]|uniref:hypothetical protein n=1 Tax=Polyangium aurulentum TaxID=2567896 RepID=UPI0010ADEDF0|nr:hypothetical protein [Polyangium aurulentum]UQA56756.1 hypothetical protein E8A73_036460 [Polyangium aurulentum]